MITIGEKVKIIRNEMQLTQKQLSRILYVSRGHISELETGRRQPSPKLMKKIEKLYKSIPQVQVMTPTPVEVKKSWFDKLLDFLLGWRG